MDMVVRLKKVEDNSQVSSASKKLIQCKQKTHYLLHHL
jgi:hypothetical protein